MTNRVLIKLLDPCCIGNTMHKSFGKRPRALAAWSRFRFDGDLLFTFLAHIGLFDDTINTCELRHIMQIKIPMRKCNLFDVYLALPSPTSAIMQPFKTHLPLVSHICVCELGQLGSDNGLSPGRSQTIIWTNAELLLIKPHGTYISQRNFIWNWKIFIQENALEHVVCETAAILSRVRWVKRRLWAAYLCGWC